MSSNGRIQELSCFSKKNCGFGLGWRITKLVESKNNASNTTKEYNLDESEAMRVYNIEEIEKGPSCIWTSARSETRPIMNAH